jgi:hypothetical protein
LGGFGEGEGETEYPGNGLSSGSVGLGVGVGERRLSVCAAQEEKSKEDQCTGFSPLSPHIDREEFVNRLAGASRNGRKAWKVEKRENRKMNPIGILALLALSACTIYGDGQGGRKLQDGPSAHPTTLTAVEAQKAAKARFDSPLDPDKPATQKAKQLSLTPPAGKVDTGND